MKRSILELNREVGDRIRFYRMEQGWTQNQLAEIVGTHANTISRWETGVDIANLADLCKLADALGVSLTTLLGEEPPSKSTTGVTLSDGDV